MNGSVDNIAGVELAGRVKRVTGRSGKAPTGIQGTHEQIR